MLRSPKVQTFVVLCGNLDVEGATVFASIHPQQSNLSLSSSSLHVLPSLIRSTKRCRSIYRLLRRNL
ncbi:hypothetical protein Y032_0443g1559 [Ancylostoma ceylanicum]|uniref:Uncharacterized protein n=1 Tax=Ancylostoma ceylanicum TaxID=53326 RepID=A0A016WZA8_9BILA|nr:hypothetical protein Y032_0443g1559 [Ancylostoma ceylanicum]